MPPPHLLKTGIQPIHLFKGGASDRQIHQIRLTEQARAQAVVQVMMGISHIIGNRRHLRLGTGMGVQLQIPGRVHLGQRIGQGTGMLGIGIRADDGSIVLGNPLKAFPCQVQAVKIGVVPLKPRHDPQGLRVVVKPAIGRHQCRQSILAGMAKGGVTQIMGQCDTFGQISVQPQNARNRPRHLRHLDRMGQPRAIVIALMFHKDLRLVLQPPKGR